MNIRYPIYEGVYRILTIQELRELSFKLSYLPLVYPTFFLMRLSVASVVFVSGA